MTQTIRGIEGHHLIFDLEGCDRAFLADEEAICAFLEGLVVELDMTKLMPVQSWKGTSSKSEHWGITAFVPIAESHITTHTFPELGAAWLDIFSCLALPVTLVCKIVEEAYKPKDYKMDYRERGLREII